LETQKVATEVWVRQRIRVPVGTVYDWIRGESKPNITPLTVCPELGYVVGAVMTDCGRTQSVLLGVTDLDFALAFKEALLKVTGREYEVKYNEKERMWIVWLSGSPLRYIAKTGLWVVVGYCFPREFLRGLFDGDGGAAEAASGSFLPSVVLINSNLRLLDFVQWLLEREFGIKTKRRVAIEEGEVEIIGRKVKVKRTEKIELWGTLENLRMLETFAEKIGFTIGWKREILGDAIKVLREHGRGRAACRAWRELGYAKLDPERPSSKWVRLEWFLNPKYRWYFKPIPKHVKRMLGERAAPLSQPLTLSRDPNA